MKNKLTIGGAVLMLAAMSALGADDTNNNQTLQYNPGELYRSCEVSFDGFGTAAIDKYTIDHPTGSRVRHDVRLGAGAGLNVFFIRYLGVGVDAYSEHANGTFVDSASASMILRIPVAETGLAPYVFGGGGYIFDTTHVSFAQGGGGLEFRFTPNIGIFADARAVVPGRTKCYGLGRLGLRLSF